MKYCLQAVQKDIESRSRIVSAVLKLCEWLKVVELAGEGETDDDVDRATVERERSGVQAEAEGVEQRWHSVWIQSVEWQLRLEHAISGGNVRACCMALLLHTAQTNILHILL